MTTEPVVQVKLPQLSLPHFNGHVSEWITFKETFLSLVGNNTTIPNVQKFHYLLSAVNGDAKRVIQHIPLNEDGYDIAWSLLTERYQNEKLIVNIHIDNIMKQPTIVTENVVLLRQLIDITKSNLKALDSMDQQTNTWDSMIIYIVVQKLDSKTKREWELFSSSKQLPKLNQLYDFFGN